MSHSNQIQVAIIGSGKLGTDLLIKVMRSHYMKCVLFIGRNEQSQGLIQARKLGVATSSDSIQAIIDYEGKIDLVFDVTSAKHHLIHAPIFERLNIKAIDLTPAKVGQFCVPAINKDAILESNNVNLVTCGGQSALPIIECLSNVIPHISKVEVQSFLAQDTVGQGTIDNIEEYYSTTASAIRQFAHVNDVDIALNLETSAWQPDMLTHIRFYTFQDTLDDIYGPLKERLHEVQNSVSGYHIVGTPTLSNGIIDISISVCGKGDWLPTHAGNLDIINCAAVSLGEHYAQYHHLGRVIPTNYHEYNSNSLTA